MCRKSERGALEGDALEGGAVKVRQVLFVGRVCFGDKGTAMEGRGVIEELLCRAGGAGEVRRLLCRGEG